MMQKIAAVYEEEIEKLKLEVQQLIAKNQQTLVANLELENEVARLRGSLSRVSADWEKNLGTSAEQPETNKAHQELKKKYNDLVLKYKQECSRLRTMEANYKANVRSSRGETSAQVVGDPADKARIAELETELASAYDVIADLEFEMDNIGHLEFENERLQTELNELKAESGNVSDGIRSMNLNATNDKRQSGLSGDKRATLMQKLELMHNKHNELYDRAKAELDSLAE